MKKLVCLLCTVSLVFLLSACGGKKEEKYDVVFIAAEDVEGEHLCGECLRSVKEFCAAEGLSLNAVTAGNTSVEVAEAVERAAVSSGARLVVVYGSQAPASVAEYEGVRQIYVSRLPSSVSAPSVGQLCFDALSCGYLTGYAAAASGYSHIGFIGERKGEEADLGLGLIQGFSDALERKEQDEGAEQFVRYWYAGTEEEIRLEASYWYSTGTQMIFAASGEIRELAASVKEEAPCFDLTQGEEAFLPLFRDALGSSLRDDGSFAAYTDGSYVGGVTSLPSCFERICSCPDGAYAEGFSALFRERRESLLAHPDAGSLMDPRICPVCETVTVEFFG